jgi:hypothetical protein
MGDTKEFLRELKKVLPNKDEQYILISNENREFAG